MSRSPVLEHAAAVLAAGRPADALQLLAPHLAQNPDDAEALRLASDGLRALERGQDAVDAATHAVRLEPENAASWHSLAFAQLTARELPAAVASATRAMQLAPADWASHANLALIAGEHDPSGALSLNAAQEAVRLAPNASGAHQSVGLALLRHKQPKPAIEAFTTALRLDPQNELARHNLAVATIRTGDPARAVVDLAGLAAQSPNNSLTLGNLRVAIGNTLGRIHTVAFFGAFASAQVALRTRGTDTPSQLLLAGIAVATYAVIAFFVVRTRRTLGSSLGPVFRFVVARDRLIAAWAVVDAFALLPLAIGPFLSPDWWPVGYGLSGLFVFTGVIIRVIRARIMRGEAARR